MKHIALLLLALVLVSGCAAKKIQRPTAKIFYRDYGPWVEVVGSNISFPLRDGWEMDPRLFKGRDSSLRKFATNDADSVVIISLQPKTDIPIPDQVFQGLASPDRYGSAACRNTGLQFDGAFLIESGALFYACLSDNGFYNSGVFASDYYGNTYLFQYCSPDANDETNFTEFMEMMKAIRRSNPRVIGAD